MTAHAARSWSRVGRGGVYAGRGSAAAVSTHRRRRARRRGGALEGPGWTGLTDPAEVIEARRLLMVEAERLMKPIDEYSIGLPGDPAALRSAATTLEPLLLALPHLFPPTTNLFDPAAHDPPTVALPVIWQRFAAFQTPREFAERAAAALAAAENGEPLRAASARTACGVRHLPYGVHEAVHAAVVTDERSRLRLRVGVATELKAEYAP